MDSRPGMKKSSWWKRRTALEKILFVILLIVSASAAVAIVVITGIFSGVILKESATGGHLVIDSSSSSSSRSHVAPDSHKVLRRGAAFTDDEEDEDPIKLTYSSHSFNSSSASLSNGTDHLTENELSQILQNHTGQQQQQQQRRHEEEERKIMKPMERMKRMLRRSEGMERTQNRKGNHSLGCFRCRRKQMETRRRSSFRFGLAVHTVTRVSKRRKVEEKTADANKSTNELCLTPDCIKIAASMLDSIDQTVDPCDDFFEYACGKWNKLHPIPDDKPNHSTFRLLDDILHTVLKELLEKPLKSTDINAIQNAKILYQSCMNTSILEEKQDGPLRALIDDLGGWPVLQANWTEDGTDLSVTMAKLKMFNHPVFIHTWVNTDDKDSDTNVIQIDQSKLLLPAMEYYLRGRQEKTLLIYQQLAINTAQALGADESRAIQQMTEMIDFEVELANITIPESERRDMELIYHRIKLKDLSKNLTNQIDWDKYFETIFSPLNITLGKDEEGVVYAVDYMRDLDKLLKKTPKRTLLNYAIWYVVFIRMDALSQKFHDLKRDLNKALQGTDQERSRWTSCVNVVNENLGMVVGRMYVEKNFEEKAKASVAAMIPRLKESFKDILMEVPWLDDSTKKVAREKADDMKAKIGYPDYIMNDTALNLDYEGITLYTDNYFGNLIHILHVAVANNHKRLRLPVDRERWPNPPAMVNAFYNSPGNLISFPAGILHPPFFHKNFPMSMNFGGIGMVIGHEITHGFDDKGRLYDKDGNMKMWWTATDVENFKEKTQCIIDQYNNFTIPEVKLNINGRQTQGENIADNGGLKQAYRAYKKWAKTHPTEKAIPGLNLTHDQLFFINFAQVWCGTNRPENFLQMIRAGKHSPGRIRVIGTVSNSEDFSKTFSCPLGSRMNPVHKCSVW